MKHACVLLISVGLFMAITPAAAQVPQDETISYQGFLTQAGIPANGAFDFEFDAYDVSSGGSPVAPFISRPGVQVVEGVFTVALNFGDIFSAAEVRWLEIRVQPSGGGGFETLAPRQQLLSAPFAVTALSGTGGGESPWSTVGTDIQYNDGKVGINTNDFSDRLHINADSGEHGFRVRIGSLTRLRVNANGGTSIGEIFTPPAEGLYVRGSATFGEVNPPGAKLFVENNSGSPLGIFARSSGPADVAIRGDALATGDNDTIGVLGQSASTSGHGVEGLATATTGFAAGLYGEASSLGGYGLHARNSSGSSANAARFDGNVWVNGNTNGNVFRVDVGGTTKLKVTDNGGLTVGSGTLPPPDGLQVDGTAHIVQRLQVNSTSTSATMVVDAPSGEDPLRIRHDGSTKLLVQTNGGVSVGTAAAANPSGLLVQGAIATNTSVTRWANIAPVDFTALESNSSWRLDLGYVSGGDFPNHSASEFAAALDLPHGAVITELRARVLDDEPDGNLSVRLKRYTLDGVDSLLAFDATDGTSSSTQTMLDNTIDNATVDNENYSYVVELDIPNGSGETSIRVYGVRVTYLTDTVYY